jgi:hypothetical protein
MAHFAKIENNIVTQVIVVDDENEENGQEFLNSLGIDGTWIKTSYNGNIRKNFASIGYTYSKQLDAFIPPKPYNSWILDEASCSWLPPIEKPKDTLCSWDEVSQSWIIA